MRTATAEKRRPMVFSEPFTMNTVQDVSGQVPAVIDADYDVLNDSGFQKPPFLRRKRRVDVETATQGKSIPEALAYHLSCIEALSRTGNVMDDTGDDSGGLPISVVDPPERESMGDRFRRMRNSFD